MNFASELRELIDGRVDAAHKRLRQSDETYRKQSYRLCEIEETLNKFLEAPAAKPEEKHWNLLREYMELEMDSWYPSYSSVYVQAVIDCVRVLTRLGWKMDQ